MKKLLCYLFLTLSHFACSMEQQPLPAVVVAHTYPRHLIEAFLLAREVVNTHNILVLRWQDLNRKERNFHNKLLCTVGADLILMASMLTGAGLVISGGAKLDDWQSALLFDSLTVLTGVAYCTVIPFGCLFTRFDRQKKSLRRDYDKIVLIRARHATRQLPPAPNEGDHIVSSLSALCSRFILRHSDAIVAQESADVLSVKHLPELSCDILEAEYKKLLSSAQARQRITDFENDVARDRQKVCDILKYYR